MKSICFFILLFSLNASAQVKLKFVQLNAWQVQFAGIDFTKDRLKRLLLLPDELANTQADIITMQEVWSNSAKMYVADEMEKRGYAYHHYTRRTFGGGNGLLVMSRFPILSVEQSAPFTPRTNTLDHFMSKRAFHLVVIIPMLGPIDVYAAHMGPVSFSEVEDAYNPKEEGRLQQQLQQLGDFIKFTRSTPFTFLGADLNSNYLAYQGNQEFKPEYSPNYLTLVNSACQEGMMESSFLTANHMTEKDPIVPTYSKKNPYVSGGMFTPIPSEVEDYILNCPNPRIHAVESKLIFTKVLLSDHYGLQTSYEIESSL